jgi:hypothetical protein
MADQKKRTLLWLVRWSQVSPVGDIQSLKSVVRALVASHFREDDCRGHRRDQSIVENPAPKSGLEKLDSMASIDATVLVLCRQTQATARWALVSRN